MINTSTRGKFGADIKKKNVYEYTLNFMHNSHTAFAAIKIEYFKIILKLNVIINIILIIAAMFIY